MSENPDPAVKPSRFYLPGAALLAVLILSPSLLYPFGRDQAVFAYVGRVIAEGGMPFRDAWDLKPPGIYALYGVMAAAAPDRGFGMMWVVRVVDIVFAAATAVLLALLARRWGSAQAGWAAAGWYAALYLQGGYWSLAQAEGFANPLLVAAALLCLAGPGRAPLLTAGGAGLLTGLAATLKVTTAAPVAVFLAWGLWREPDSRVSRALAFLGGAALGLAAAGAWLWAGGALEAYLDIQRGFVGPYTQLSDPGPGQRAAAAVEGVAGWCRRFWGPLLLVAGLSWCRERRPHLAAAALAAAAAVVVVQNKFFLYHWETALPWLAVAAGFGSVALLERMGARPCLAVALPLAWTLTANWGAYRDGTRSAAGLLPREQFLRRFTSGHDYSFPATLAAAEYVASGAGAGQKILVWGFEPGVYLLSGHRAPTRFFFNVPVSVAFSPPAWKAEFVADLQRDPPELILVVRRDAIPWANGLRDDSATQLRSWPELARMIDRHYRFEAQLEDFSIYRRARSIPSG